MSLVNSTIDEYVLASFPVSSSSSPPSQSLPPPPPVSAVQYPSAPRQDRRLCVATPGVGLSVYDLADQTPLSSITVGPSFAPTTAAVARSVPLTSSESIRVQSTRQTWVGVRTDEGKGEIWCWQEEERKDGSSEGEAGKAVWPISEPLAALAVPRTLPSHLVFLSSSGSLALAPSSDLTSLVSLPYATESSESAPAPTSQTLRLIPVSAASAPSFLPASLIALLPPTASKSRAHLAIIVRTFARAASTTAPDSPASLVEIGKKKFRKTARPSSAAVIDAVDEVATRQTNEIEVVLLDPEVAVEDEMEPRHGVVSLGRLEVEADKVVVSDDGFVTTLGLDGTLSSFRLALASSAYETYSAVFFPSAPTEPASPSLSLSPIKSVFLSTRALAPACASLLALHSSFVLLASPRPASDSSSTPVVSLTYWDSRFGAVVASSDLTVPSAVASSISSLSLSTCLPTRHTALLTLFPSVPTTTASRLAIFCLPLSPPLPSSSVLAAIVGRQRLTGRYLAFNADEDSVSAKAKRAEPMTSLRAGQSTGEKQRTEESRKAREALLEEFEALLAPLKEGGKVEEQAKAVEMAEEKWDMFLEEERKRTWEVERPKLAKRRKEEAERKVEELKDGWRIGADNKDGRWRWAKSAVEKAILEGGGSAELDDEEAEGEEGPDQVSWKTVAESEINGVDEADRLRYFEERSKIEEEIKGVREEAKGSLDAVERPEPALPSAFVTALFRLSFPVALDAPSTELSLSSAPAPATTTSTWRHPTKIVAYLFERGLVGENQIEGGVARYLARAGDWPNIQLALVHLPDIPETTTISLLRSVVRAQQPIASTGDNMEIDTIVPSALPAPVPSLRAFLPAFLKQPFTPSVLRQALQKQLSAVEALPVLELCDEWLAWWLKDEHKDGEKDERKVKKGKKMALVDPFRPRKGQDVPPTVDEIVPLVQSLLDAHFVTLLLQRQSHKLLRRLSSHVSTHTALLTDLSSLLGALSVYSRKQDELRQAQAAEVEKRAGAAGGDVKKFGETMERRIKAQEKHAQVGEYQVEEFYL
ncbi:hypothetical protein JCM1841_001531 [Sporobolomyces salmonicolor]